MMAAAQQPLRGVLLHDEPMARHTSWRVGGPADRFYRPADVDDLCVFLAGLPANEPLMWLGLGSNLLVRDGGIRGTVIATSGCLNELARVDDGTVRVEAGVACAKLARFCARQGLVGAEFFAGIPGCVGGALAMNAGAFGGETWALVDEVECVDRHGRLRVRRPEAFNVGYRQVSGPAQEWFVAARLRLQPGDAAQASARIKALLERRAVDQPIGLPSCGSVFRNPPGDHAARLIEACGLKGVCVGGACVSEKHANFIVNTGAATAADIEALIGRVAQTVERQHSVAMRLEVHVCGEASGS